MLYRNYGNIGRYIVDIMESNKRISKNIGRLSGAAARTGILKK